MQLKDVDTMSHLEVANYYEILCRFSPLSEEAEVVLDAIMVRAANNHELAELLNAADSRLMYDFNSDV